MMGGEDLDYLRRCLEATPFTPYPWDGEDRNLGAFRSKKELIAWYCQPPGEVAQPYRDRAFYSRELAMLSRTIRPRTVVEFGTSLGIGTCLLRWLNPTARLVTVDVNDHTFLPGDLRVPMGYLAKWQGFGCEYIRGNSWDYAYDGVDLCFIDADHSYDAVVKDSHRALSNRSTNHRWVIAWHDHNDRHPGVVQAVSEFCALIGVALQWRPDSDTVWVEGGRQQANYGTIDTPYFEWWLNHNPFQRQACTCPICASDTGCFEECPAREIQNLLNEVGDKMREWIRRRNA